MWLKSEIEALRNGYNDIKGIKIGDVVDEAEAEAIEETAIYNLKNSVEPLGRNISKFLACVRLQYLCIDM